MTAAERTTAACPSSFSSPRHFTPRPGAVPLIRPLLPNSSRLCTWGGWYLVAVAIALMVGLGGANGQEAASTNIAEEPAAASVADPIANSPDPDPQASGDEPRPDQPAGVEPAKEGDTPKAPSSPAAASTKKAVSPVYSDLDGRIEVVGPDTYLLLDAEGNPQPVLNLSYEEFLKLMQLKQGGTEPGAGGRRQYTHERLDIQGTLKEGYAEFTATMEITLHTADTVEVPLRFAWSILRKQPEPPPRADGRFLNFADEERGWIATLQGQPGEKVTLALDFIAPIERNGDRSTLRLHTPRASVGKLRLESAAHIESGGVSASGGVVVKASPIEGDAEGTRIEANGLGGEFRLSWEEQQQETITETASVLSSVGQLRYQIDGNNVQTEARLEVSSLGAQFDTFRVRLPEGAEYIRYEDRTVDQGGTVGRMIKSVEREPQEPGATPQGQVYVVKLNAETKDPVILQLATNHQLEREGEKGRVRLHGFEVLGAVRQDGKIGLGVDSQLQLSFGAENLQQVDLSEFVAAGATASPGEELTVALRYFSLPWALDLEVAKRERRVSAASEYDIKIDKDEIRLDMTVVYEITGLGKGNSRVSFPLNFDLRGWQLTNDRVETLGLEDAAEAVPSESRDGENGANILRYPYATATTDRPRMVLHLRRDLSEQEPFVTALPFVADPFAMGTSKVKVTVAPGLLFTPNTAAIEGLAPLPLDDLTLLAPGTAPGQQFEYRGFLPEPVFAGSLKPRPQHIASRVATRIALNDRQARVEQTIHLDIRYQPLDALSLVIPSEVMRDGNLEVAWVRPELTGASADDVQSDKVRLELPPATEGATAAVAEVRIPLVRPQTGKLDVIVSYQVAAPAATSETTWIVPLVTPLGTELNRQTVRVEGGDDQVFSPVGGSNWRVDTGDKALPGVAQFSCNEALNYLPLSQRTLPRAAGVTHIERIWLQTWLTEGIAQQRLAVAFRSNKSEEVVELPEGVDPMDVEVFLDGIQVADAKPSAAQLVVPLTATSDFARRTIELRYRQPYRFAWVEPLNLEVPRLASGNESLAVMYWQVVVPTRYLALQTPAGCVDAYTCRWNAGDWRAEGDRGTQDLESWIGGILRERPTMAEHALLWRGDPRRSQLEVWLVRRELIVLACSVAVLGVVLTLVYLPVLRRRGVWLTLAVAVAALGVMYPNAARVVAQGGLLGGIAAMVAIALAAVSRRAEPESTVASPATGSTIVPPASRGSSIAPLGTGTLSTNAPTISIELSDAPS